MWVVDFVFAALTDMIMSLLLNPASIVGYISQFLNI